MNLLLAVVLVVLFLALLLFATVVKAAMFIDSDCMKMRLSLRWLYPLVKAVVENEEQTMVLKVYLFKQIVYRKALTAGGNTSKGNGMELIRQVEPTNIHVQASYGFRDPSVTGMICGALYIVSQFVKIDAFFNDPDFVAERDYVRMNATALFSPGRLLAYLIRERGKTPERQLSYQNR